MDDLSAAMLLDSSVKKLEDFQPAYHHIARFGDADKAMRILDFGCGLGRNIIGMLQHSEKWTVWGYDNAPALEHAKKFYGDRLASSNRVFLTDKWDAMMEMATKDKRGKFFDLIFAAFVFQHIEIEEMRSYLSDMATMTKRLYVFGRRANDSGWNGAYFVDNWKIIAEKFDAVELDIGLIENDGAEDHHCGIYKPKRETNV